MYLLSPCKTQHLGRDEIERLSYILLLIDTGYVIVLHSLSVQGSFKFGSGIIDRVTFDLAKPR